MTKTRRPKGDKPRESLTAKIPGELKEILVSIAETEERSLSQIVERFLVAHPDVKSKIVSNLEIAAPV